MLSNPRPDGNSTACVPHRAVADPTSSRVGPAGGAAPGHAVCLAGPFDRDHRFEAGLEDENGWMELGQFEPIYVVESDGVGERDRTVPPPGRRRMTT